MKNKILLTILVALIGLFSFSTSAEARPIHGKRTKKIIKTRNGGRTVIIKKHRRGRTVIIRKNRNGRTRTIVPNRGRRNSCNAPIRGRRLR